jgi:hypothetical protein
MRFRSIAVITLLSCAAVGGARAQTTPQDPQCNNNAADVCQQALDLVSYMVPQLGISITGGNVTLGQGGALGGLPHFTIGLRANVLSGAVPQVQSPNVATGPGFAATRRNPYPTSLTPLGLPAIDASVGLFKGVPLGLTNVGGVDLLLSMSYIPKITKDATSSSVKVEPNSSTQIGYGVRIGLLQESLVVPGVAFSYFKRDLPTTSITGTFTPVGTNDTLAINNMSVKTNAWRLTASKSLILFTIAAGVGGDSYDTKASVHAGLHHTLPIPVTGTSDVSFARKMSRTNYFADLGMNILLLKIVGEVGMVSGGSMPTYNVFKTAADASHVYGSVGLRLGF